ncbi:MAG: type II toxin-antitoxin system VapC family toxin [Candidatus Aminicenantes bacterium]|nr:type II toxin-antitoxin system VapC family toxin [Candidatus Aminicenantes bacterium]
MIALDANLLIRLIVEDDFKQAEAAESLLKNAGDVFFIPDLVLAELVWVLERRYAFSKPEVEQVLSELLGRRDVVFEDESRVRAAVRAYGGGLDLADGLIVETAREIGCRSLASFDDVLVSKYPSFVLRPES